MQVLVVGGGGREHALAWKLAHSPRVTKVFVAPGNAGTAHEEGCVNIDITDIEGLANFHEQEKLAFTIVGPEAPLAAGIVDAFRERGLRIFGPVQGAARLESSKEFAKAFMARHGIPTAAYACFDDPLQAHEYVDAQGAPIVVKADGLAAGKGVVVCFTEAEAHAAIDDILGGQTLGDAGSRLVIEEFLQGEEASFIVMADGKTVLPLATSQDHKRLKDGDEGPNTGGMGAYSPAPIVTPEMHARIMREVVNPTIKGMTAEGFPYTGFLYAGLMIGADGSIKVLEFNCRLGDPETQPIAMRLKSDLFELVDKALNGHLDQAEADWDRRAALGVVLASAGYPQKPQTGDTISGLVHTNPDVHVFHAGTALRDGKVVTAGGRVLAVTALGDTLAQARRHAYEVADAISFAGKQMRTDIGHRALR